jgi:serine/threonine-protein kinase
MPLSSGTRLGVYEVVAPLGAGGMGEVYRARDTKLGREVAIKILPESFVDNPERIARFEREAQLLAALNHPHIAAIHGLESAGATQFLVLELVEGETLAAKLEGTRGLGLGIHESLAVARQIADALQAAHEKGIIHRDLKPANIAFTLDGQVKVLDFGLAKHDAGSAGSSAAAGPVGMTHSPTITFAHTQVGVILGTAAYMSPEQAKGRAADKRSDVWAFGCVLYEMLTGTRAFDGEDVTDIIAAVVRGEPDWSALPRDLSGQLRRLLERCLEKDRRQRIADIAVAQFLLTETTVPAQAPVTRSRQRTVAASAAGLIIGVAATAIAAWMMLPRPLAAPLPVRFTIVPAATQTIALQGGDRKVAISADGARVVYRLTVGSQPTLFTRALNELDAHPLSGPGGRDPFMSPDGRWIAYFTATDLRKVAVSGGPPVTICKLDAQSRGASWADDDTIIFSVADPRAGLQRVSAGGGAPTVLTTADGAKNEIAHAFPHVLPGANAVLFTISSGAIDTAQIAVLDLKSRQHKILLRGGTDAKYVDSGHLIYAAGGGLRAVRFDLSRLEILGDSVPVLDQTMTEVTGAADYDVSRRGNLVFVPGGAAAPTAQARSLVWVDRQGREEPINAPPRAYAIPRVSPDGTRVALDVRDQSNDIWIWDLARQTLTPLNLDPGVDMSPVWTPDSRRIVWTSSRAGGNPNLYWQAADGTGTPERLTTSAPAQFPVSMSPDGTRVALFTGTELGGGLDLNVLTLDRTVALPPKMRTEPLIQSTATKFNPEISPDGRWIALQSNESGQPQIYVRPFPAVDGGRWQISPDGGTRPAWSRNGRELFYLNANDLLTAVSVVTGATFTAGKPVKVLNTRYYAGSTTRGYDLRGYDVSPDGQRFLMVKENAPANTPRSPSAAIIVVLNWAEELKQRLTERDR